MLVAPALVPLLLLPVEVPLLLLLLLCIRNGLECDPTTEKHHHAFS